MNSDYYTSPDNKHSALIIIDVQRDFTLIGSSTEIPGTLQVVQYIQPLVQAYRELGHPVIHVVRLYRADGSNVDMCRRKQIENGKQMVVPEAFPTIEIERYIQKPVEIKDLVRRINAELQ